MDDPQPADDREPPTAATLSDEQVRRVARLARLTLDDAEIHAFARQLSGVLAYMARLNELDVSDVEPMAHAVDLRSVMREDRVGPALSVDAVLANAPDRSPPFFKVPKVLGEDSGA